MKSKQLNGDFLGTHFLKTKDQRLESNPDYIKYWIPPVEKFAVKYDGEESEEIRVFKTSDIAKNKYDFANKYKVTQFKRVYCNAHTHGIEPHIHRDDGDQTFIYYPRLDWKPEWGGGTSVFDEDKNVTHHFGYKGNRVISFKAGLMHQAQPVSRECYHLRTCIVFKTNRVKE